MDADPQCAKPQAQLVGVATTSRQPWCPVGYRYSSRCIYVDIDIDTTIDIDADIDADIELDMDII